MGGAYGELWHRDDGGDWVQAGLGRFGTISSILVDPVDRSFVVVWRTGGSTRSRNGGIGFVPLRNGLGDVYAAG